MPFATAAMRDLKRFIDRVIAQLPVTNAKCQVVLFHYSFAKFFVERP